MKVSFSYGLLNKSNTDSQSVYIRVKHNTLQFKRTLHLPIQKEWWDFKNKRLVKEPPAFMVHESKKVFDFTSDMINVYEREFYNDWAELKYQIKTNNVTLTTADWKTWCEKVIERVNTPVDLISEKPKLVELWKRYIELKSGTGAHRPSTTKTWKARLRAYIEFENYEFTSKDYTKKKKHYTTDQLDLNFYAEFRKYILHKKNTDDKLETLRSLNYFGDFIKKIKAVAEYYQSEGYKFHDKVLSKDFKAVYKSPPHDILTPSELKKIWSLSHISNFHKDVIKQSKILYFACLRVSDLELNLKKGFNRLQKDLTRTENEFEEPILEWTVTQQKSDSDDPTKIVPILHKEVEAMLTDKKHFPKFIHENEFNPAIRELALEAGIKDKSISTHTFRRSLLTNMLNANKYTLSELMRFSGHSREDTLRIYLKKQNIKQKTKVRIDDDGKFI